MSFTFTESKYIALLNRIIALENHVNDLNTAATNLASVQQVKEILVILQSSLIELNDKITALENRIVAIEEEPIR